jgi:hypothetical protein
MQAEWTRHLLALYGTLAVSMVLSLYLWLSARIESEGQASRERGARREFEARLDAACAELQGLRADVAALESSLHEMQETSGALVAPSPPRSGLNLSVRSQVLRRSRLGEPPAGIAASLGLPRAEVELLLKVNRIVVENL